MSKLFDTPPPPRWRVVVSDWFWGNLVRVAVVLATVAVVADLGQIFVPVQGRGVFSQSRGAAETLMAVLILSYCFRVWRGSVRGHDFWMNKAKGFYVAVAAVFFASATDSLRIFAQTHGWKSDSVVEMLVLGLLWSTQYWPRARDREVLSVLLRHPSESEPSRLTQIKLSGAEDRGPLA